MSEPPEDADVETASSGYARRFDSPVGAWMLQTQRDITLELLGDLPKGVSVLDVGGGHGQLAPALAERGSAVSVLASSSQAVGAALRPALDAGRVSCSRATSGTPRSSPVRSTWS